MDAAARTKAADTDRVDLPAPGVASSRRRRLLVASPLKPSRFHFWASLEGDRHLLFSGTSGALLELTGREKTRVQRLFTHSRSGIQEERAHLEDILVEGRFLVEEDCDEAAELIAAGEEARRAPSALNLQVVPTYQCNFRCTYCYVDFRQGRMTPKIAASVVSHVDSMLANYGELNLTWFGGEPLLCLETVEATTFRIREVAERRGVSFRGFLATNGYHLSAETATRLCACGVRYLHATVDGPAPYHDRLRMDARGQATYRRIMDNVLSVLERVDEAELTLRMNANEENIAHLEQVFHEIPPSVRGRVQLSITPIRQDGARVSLALRRQINLMVGRGLEMGFRYYSAPLPVARRTFCHADEPGSFQIGPDGTLYACSPGGDKHEVEVGRLAGDGTAVLGPAYERWHSAPALGADCRDCPFLCFCAGGCRLQRLRSSADGSCRDEFDDLDGLIRNLYLAARVGRLEAAMR